MVSPSFVVPGEVTIGDLCEQALRECGAVGVGQTPLADDVTEAWGRLQFMLQQWDKKRWLVYHLKTYNILSRGEQSYSFGPGADFDTGPDSMRPSKISSAFTRQQFQATNPIDYQLEILQSKEDYNQITLKSLVAGPGEAIFLDSDWPWSYVYIWPIPQANIYEIFVTVYEQIPFEYANLSTIIVLPFEYYNAILYNLAIRLRPKYRLGTYPGDSLPGMARDSLAVVRGNANQIMKLRMPEGIRRRGGTYNIFSDRP